MHNDIKAIGKLGFVPKKATIKIKGSMDGKKSADSKKLVLKGPKKK
jgi:hypothetical protein